MTILWEFDENILDKFALMTCVRTARKRFPDICLQFPFQGVFVRNLRLSISIACLPTACAIRGSVAANPRATEAGWPVCPSAWDSLEPIPSPPP